MNSFIRIGKQYLVIFFTLVNIITAYVFGAKFGPRLLHKSDLFSASNLTSPGSILNPAPLPEHLDPVIYRATWSKPKSDISPIEYDVFEPIDHENGKGSGWTIVFIHGLGSVDSSHGHQWRETLLSTLQRPLDSQSIGNLTGLRFILPKAPIIPITVYSDQPNGGKRPGWFDIKDWRDLNHLEDEDSLRQSCIQISTIIAEQVRESKMQMNKTIIAGFSQGAVMTLLTSLTLSEPPAATLMLSGYLPLPFRLPLLLSTVPGFYRSTAFYWLHGTTDEVLTYNAAKSGFNFLRRISQEAFGRAKFKTLPGLAHGFSENEQIVVTNWIEGIVDQGTGGEFDDLLDNLIQPENKLDDPQYPVPHS
ncbi:Phospholipase/Carboxylesterase-domain-containing protein [Melampsora americana]|nr:Phospholipase/Carboxylesterase-domain-containing protein [Melampsora americana]